MNKKLKEKVMEALSSVVPITGIVLVLSFTVAPMPVASLMLFLVGAVLLIVGVGFFSLGVDMSMMPIGDGIGRQIANGKHIWAMAPLCFLIGAFVTIAEPDLQVLAKQVPAVPDMVSILTVAAGEVRLGAEPAADRFLHRRLCTGLFGAKGVPGGGL